MSAVALLDAVSAAGFGCALFLLARAGDERVDATSRVFLGAALAVYVFVGVSNVVENAGWTAAFDEYEDYAENLFVPFFLFGLHSLSAKRQLDRRVAAEEEVRASRERYRTLVENVDLGITLVGADYRILMANAAQGRLVGAAPEALVGRTCHEAYEGRAEPCEVCAGRRALTTGRPATDDKVVDKPDGTRRAVRLRAFPVAGRDGRPEGFIEVVEDRTERARDESERRRVEGQIVQAQKLESLVALTGGIAHDFNNLLMSVLGNTEMSLRRLPPDSPAAPLLRRIENAALRAADLTRQLTAYAGGDTPHPAPLDLNRLVEGLAPVVGAVAARGVAVRLRLAVDLPSVQGDVDQLRQVLMTFVANASEALAEADGVIEIRTGALLADRSYLDQLVGGAHLAEGPFACLAVSDTGTGIDPSNVPKLFDPFYSTKDAGRGLGLPAALGIARAHGGTVGVETTPGQGSRFRLLLPLDPAAGLGRPASVTERSFSGRGLPLVLVADDEETARTVTRMSLRELGFDVLVTPLAAECLRLAAEHRSRLAAVVLDAALAREEGLERVRAACPGVPVVLSCGHGERDEAEALGRQEGVEVVHKPYRRDDLVAVVARALAGRGTDP